MSDRPKGGRRPEDFPEVRDRDDRILKVLWLAGPVSRNYLADLLDIEPRMVRYALERLRSRGLAEHIAKGNEGHGYWAAIKDEKESDHDRVTG
jgi:predicted ArsR family transcriptional regulator